MNLTFRFALLGLGLASLVGSSVTLGSLPPESNELKEWSLLVYLNGNNNLDSWATEDLLEMERVGSQSGFHVVVQWSSFERKKTERLYVQKSADPTRVTSPVVQDMGLVDMGDWRNLADFLEWGIKTFPAKKHFVVVWDHGTGWHDLKRAQMGVQDISQDDFSGHWITTPQLRWALTRARLVLGHSIDLYASDACLMGMIEVAAELSNSVGVYGGSVVDIPVAGWPYDSFLNAWKDRPGLTAQEVGRLLASEYQAYYQSEPKNKGATYAFYDLSKTGEMLGALKAFKMSLLKIPSSETGKLRDALSPVYDFTIDYSDLGMLVDAVASARIMGFETETAHRLKAAMRDFVLVSVATPTFSRSQGVSIWLPSAMRWYKKYLSSYKLLRISRETGWEEVLPLFTSY